MIAAKSAIISVLQAQHLKNSFKKFQFLLFIFLSTLSSTVLSSQLECRTKSAFILANLKNQYSGQIPNETIEFAKEAVMEMCISMATNTAEIVEPDENIKINRSKEKKKSFLGINFGNSERKKGNERLMNRR